jgi:hypothetical protein
MRNINNFAPAGLFFMAQGFLAHAALGMELDILIPPGIPGLGEPAPLTVIGHTPGLSQPVPWQFGGFTLQPQLNAGFGYNSAPGATTTGSNVLSATPSLVVADVPAGFGAYLEGTTSYLPSETAQDTSGYTVAVGEAAVLPQETITIAGGYARTTETGFGLSTLDLSKPLSFTVGSLDAGDKIAAGMFTVTPDVSYTRAVFDALPDEDSWQIRGRTQVEFAPGGPMRVVTLAEATQSSYRDESFDASSYAALVGIDDDATGLWEFRILGGAAWRQPRTGRALVAPVVEAAASWAPTELDNVSLTAAHEIDDPDQIGAAGYMLTQGQLSYQHELQRTLDFTSSFSAAHAAYFGTRLNESLFDTSAQVSWHVNTGLALNASYAFADRQANYLRAANEHVFTLTAVWTP